MDYGYALGDKKCNLPWAGSREGAHYMLADLCGNTLNLSSDRLSKILEEMGDKDSGIASRGLGLIEDLVKEAIQLRDQQSLAAIKSLPGGA